MLQLAQLVLLLSEAYGCYQARCSGADCTPQKPGQGETQQDELDLCVVPQGSAATTKLANLS